MILDTTAPRVAAAFARQPVAAAYTVDEIARDALTLTRHAAAARRALSRQTKADTHFDRATPIAEKYGARVVANSDLEGLVLGLRFRSVSEPAGFSTVFHVT